jgi:hypothetical protein
MLVTQKDAADTHLNISFNLCRPLWPIILGGSTMNLRFHLLIAFLTCGRAAAKAVCGQ